MMTRPGADPHRSLPVRISREGGFCNIFRVHRVPRDNNRYSGAITGAHDGEGAIQVVIKPGATVTVLRCEVSIVIHRESNLSEGNAP